jgi:hypothetical protein
MSVWARNRQLFGPEHHVTRIFAREKGLELTIGDLLMAPRGREDLVDLRRRQRLGLKQLARLKYTPGGSRCRQRRLGFQRLHQVVAEAMNRLDAIQIAR